MPRYIDAERLQQEIKDAVCFHCQRNCHACSHFLVLEYLEYEPTADVAPVVHGKWILKCDRTSFYQWKECSRCGRTIHADENEPYCHCGAKMDGLKLESNKMKVEYAHIISHYVEKPCYRNSGNIYYEIEYKPIDKDDTHIGFGSYALNIVLDWLNTKFEIVIPKGENCNARKE